MILQVKDIIGSYFWLRSSLFLVITDEQGIVLEMNPFARKFSNWDGLPGSFLELIVDFNQEIRWADLDKGNRSQHRLSVQRKDKEPVSFYFGFSKVDSGYMIVGEQDLVEMLDYQSKMINLSREMSQLMRMQQKTNAELAEKNRQINQFLGMAAHDLRNPIGVVLNYSEYIKEEYCSTMNAQGSNFLDIIISSSEFMLRLLDDLLDVVKIKDGKINLNIREIELVELIQENIVRNRVLAKRKEISIEFDHSMSALHAEVDSDKMEQVLNNLITNAVKFSHPGSTVRVHLKTSDDQYFLEVHDQGIGIPEDKLPFLFEAFGSHSSNGTAGEKSVGLGLVIVKRIIEALGGEITVSSKFGTGTSFHVQLPLKQSAK